MMSALALIITGWRHSVDNDISWTLFFKMGDFLWTFSKGDFLWTLLVTSHGQFQLREHCSVPGQVRLGQLRLGQVKLGQVRLGQVWVRFGFVQIWVRLGLGQVRLGLGQVKLGQVWLGLGQVWLGKVRFGQFRLGQVWLGQGQVWLGQVRLQFWIDKFHLCFDTCIQFSSLP